MFPVFLALFLAMGLPGMARAAVLDADVEEFPVELFGGQTTQHVFTFEGGTGKCGSAAFTGSLPEPSESFSLAPSYGECTAFGLINATVSANGCEYEFQIGEESESENFPSTLDIVCEPGKAITLVTATCEIQVPAQTGLSAVVLANTETEPNRVDAEISITGISYTKAKDGFLCPLNGTGAKTDGTLVGSTQIQGEQLGAEVALQIGGRNVLCETAGTNNVCPKNGEYKTGTSVVGQTAENTAKLIVKYNDGMVVKDLTITCKNSSMSVKTTDNWGRPVFGGLPAKLESLNFQGCKEAGGEECTATEMLAPTSTRLATAAGGNGSFKANVKIRVICGKVPFFNCDYEGNPVPTFTGGMNATMVAPAGAPLEIPQVNHAGQVNCANNGAKWSGSYKSNLAAWLTE